MQTVRASLSAVDYLAREMTASVRHEYVDGHAYALSGASLRHGSLVTNFVAQTHLSARRRPPCRVFSQSVKVHVSARNSFYYPDVVATCEVGTREEYVVREPCFIIEVLSPSTASIDRREKRMAYATLDSLEQYVVVDQDRMRADVYCRGSKGWNLSILREPQEVVQLTCLDCALTLEQIYAGIDLPMGVEEPTEEEEWLMA